MSRHNLPGQIKPFYKKKPTILLLSTLAVVWFRLEVFFTFLSQSKIEPLAQGRHTQAPDDAAARRGRHPPHGDQGVVRPHLLG